MCDILIFGGTTEGRQLAEFCAGHGINACIRNTALSCSLSRNMCISILAEKMQAVLQV